jgi:site-specific DNA recombinase
MRILGQLRLSRSTDESTSIDRQRELIQQWSDANGHTVAGWAEDSDVSGSVDPFDTPQLADWLGNRAPEFDVIACWKLDRLSRNAIKLNKLFGWCIEHDKTVVSCSESIDLSTPVGRLIANVIGFLAEGELEAIRERSRSSKAKLRDLGRWPGGKVPYGYTSVPIDGGGWSLEIDPDAAAVVRRIVDEFLDGRPLAHIAQGLNEDGVPPSEVYRGRSTGDSWHVSSIRNKLRSKSLLGYVHHQGETARDDSGAPLVYAEPLVSLDEWDRVQAALDSNQSRRTGAKPTKGLLTGLRECHFCGEPMYFQPSKARGKLYRYYQCASRNHTAISTDELEKLVEDEFLEAYGDEPVRERVWVPGDSHEAELREAVTAFDELTTAAGRMKSATATQRLQRQLDALGAKIAQLESAPVREARYEYRATGQTYRQVWEALDMRGKAAQLAKSGITLAVGIEINGRRSKYNVGAFRCEIHTPEDWPEPMLTAEDLAMREAFAQADAQGARGVNIGPDGPVVVQHADRKTRRSAAARRH